MSEASPSLEEDIPLALREFLERSEEDVNVFTPKITTPIYAGGVKYHQKRPSAGETESFLSDAQRNECALQQLFDDGDASSGKSQPQKRDGRFADLQAMSVLSMYRDNLSQDMNTDRDASISDAATQAAMDNPHVSCKKSAVPNGTDPPNTCSVLLGGFAVNPSLTFNDNIRSIDFVLVWESAKDFATTPEAHRNRKIFEDNLEKEGLELEREAPDDLHGLHFVKVHAPESVLKDYTEILKLRMPMKECSRIQKGGKTNAILNAALYMTKFTAIKEVHEKTNTCIEKIEDAWDAFMSKIRLDPKKFPERKHKLTAVYSKDKEFLFDTKADCFWTPSIRCRIVKFILDRKRFSESDSDDFAFGISRLIANNTYSAAYPLHDGDLKTPGSLRHLLYTEWGSINKWIRYQPLDYVKDYFGVKIALYFAWLGFYTHMLIPAAFVGLICFIYSVATIYSYKPSEEICSYNTTIKMCPLCDYFCDYWNLKDSCLQSRITYLVDNSTTVFFAVFMSFWTACFLELWKRYSAEMTHRWDLTGYDVYEEHPRPQYLARLAHVKRTELNVVTGVKEPMVPFWRMKLPLALLSFSVVSLLVLLAVATVLGVVLYRMSMLGAAILRQNDNVLITSNPIMFTSATAACINLLFIFIFNFIYQYLAEWLTEKELLRTQTEFDDSLTLKIYLLQFVNYYASIFYIAFFKGKWVGRPGDYVRLFGHRQEECAPGGCLLELSIQLAIIMVGKQIFNTMVEMVMPYLLQWWNILRTVGRKNQIYSPLQWVKDFKLVDFGIMGLFPEYLEMVLQYGFVTIFVAAFPLAPLFALLNNVLEMRLDAKKFLLCYRRPVPQRVTDIGVWFRILDSIGKLSIITNGFIIAFTSEFIPRLVYQFHHSGSLDQYVNMTLSDFNVTVLEHPPIHTTYNQTTCSFPGYWYNSTEGADYERSDWYWHVMGARLAFVVVFELHLFFVLCAFYSTTYAFISEHLRLTVVKQQVKNVVALVMIIVRWAIPDMSSELRDRIRREAYVINSFILEETKARSHPQQTHAEGTDVSPTHWNQLLSASLTGSDFDLAAHGTEQHKGLSDIAKNVVEVKDGTIKSNGSNKSSEFRELDPGPSQV